MPQYINMFDNLTFGPMPLCVPGQPKELHYQGLIAMGIIPIVHIPMEKLRDVPVAQQALQQYPECTGLIISFYYKKPYS